MSKSTGTEPEANTDTEPEANTDTEPEANTGISAAQFRDLMARVCAPVTIVTTSDADGPHGATASSFAALSQEPPLVTVAFDRRSALLARIQSTQRFGINLLGHDQDELAMLFASRGPRFAETSWRHDGGLPRIDGIAGWVSCDLYNTIEGGDHLILMGLVTKVSKVDRAPLVYAQRTFGTHSRFADRPRTPITDQIAACLTD